MTDEPYVLPHGWTWATVQDAVLGAQSGFASGKKNVQAGIKHLRMNNISEACTLDLSSVTTVPKDLARPAHILKPGDILFCHTNSMKLVGKTTLFDRADGPYAFSNHLTRLRVPADGPPPEWLWYWLATLWRQRYFETRCKQWVNQATVERGTLLSAPIPVAPLREQRRIVAHVTKMIALNRIARNRLQKLPGIIRQFRQAVLGKAFRGELSQRDPNDEPAQKLLERIRQERGKKLEGELRATGKDPRRHKYKEPEPADSDQLPRLPDGWAWSRVDWVADVRLGRQRSPKNRPNKYPRKYLRAANIIDGTLDLSDVKQMDFKPGEFDVYKLRRGDVLLSEGSGSPYEVGKCGVWDERIPDCCIQNTVIRVRSEHISPQYLLYVFMYARYKGDFAKMAKGIEIGHLGAKRLAGYKIPLAPKSEQLRMIERIDSLLAMTKTLERPMETALRNTDHLEHSLLSCAFRGKLVLQDPNDEPASVLLERIRAQRATVTKRGKYRLEEFAISALVAPKA